MDDGPGPAAAPTGVAILSDAPLGDASRDYFGFRAYAEAIASLIDNDLTDTPLTIALSAPWGGGKTSVALMVRRRLVDRTLSRGGQRPVLGCWFDAWMHSDAEHLGAALAAAVARTANAGRPLWRRVLTPVPAVLLTAPQRSRRRVLVALAVALLAALVVVTTELSVPVSELLGITIEREDGAAAPLLTFALLGLLVARSVFSSAADAARWVTDPGSEASSGSMLQVKEQLGHLIDQGRRGGRLVIYVDDLERCAPERALEVCEATSQLLSHEGVVTLIVADMHEVAVAAGARYPGEDGAGRRYLEKIVQVQVALPAPHRDHIRRQLLGEAPDEAFSSADPLTPMARSPDAGPASVAELVATTVGEVVSAYVYMVLAGLLLLSALVLAVVGADVVLIAALLAIPLVVIAILRVVLALRARAARREADAIRDVIRDAVSDQQPQDEVVRRVLSGRAERFERLALDLLESYRLDHTPELDRVAAVVVKYAPPRPRGAKRVLNQARLLTQIARDRRVFGGDPELVPEHLGAWIVLVERWPDIAAQIAAQPSLMTALERGDNPDAVTQVLRADGLEMPAVPDDLVDLLVNEPPLSQVIARLVHLEPAAGSGLRCAEVLGVDRGT